MEVNRRGEMILTGDETRWERRETTLWGHCILLLPLELLLMSDCVLRRGTGTEREESRRRGRSRMALQEFAFLGWPLNQAWDRIGGRKKGVITSRIMRNGMFTRATPAIPRMRTTKERGIRTGNAMHPLCHGTLG